MPCLPCRFVALRLPLTVPLLAALGAAQEDKSPPAPLDPAALDAYVAKVREAFQVPALGVAVVHKDRTLVAKGYGLRDRENQQPADADTLFAIGSSTKAFTALTVALLAEDGKLALDDPVREHLPGFALHDEYASRNLTVEGLLCHRSGLPRHDLVWYGSKRSRSEIFAGLRHLQPNRQLRAAWQYQNLMYMTAGYLVGQKTKSTWEAFTRQRILDPLGMKRSNLSVEVSKRDANAAQPYVLNDDKLELVPFRNLDAIGPAGSINSSARDMAQWLRMLLGKGSLGKGKAARRIASRATIEGLMRPRMVMPGGRGGKEFGYRTYALGWMVQTYRGQLMVHHGGNIDGFSALVTLVPDADLGVVVLSNLGANPSTALIPRWVTDQVLELPAIDWLARTKQAVAARKKATAKAAAGKRGKRVEGTRPAHPLESYAGEYVHPGYGTLTVSGDGKVLRARLNGIVTSLEHFHYEVFEAQESAAKGLKLQFHTDLRGGVQRVSAKLEPQGEPIGFVRRPASRLRDPAFLSKLAGKYKLETGGQTVTVEAKDAVLYVTVPRQPTYQCVPASGLRFDLKGLKGFAVEFKLDRDESQAVSLEFDQPNGLFPARRVADK